MYIAATARTQHTGRQGKEYMTMTKWAYRAQAKNGMIQWQDKATGEDKRAKVVYRTLFVTDCDDLIPSMPCRYRVALVKRNIKLQGHTTANPKVEVRITYSLSHLPKVRVNKYRLVTDQEPAQYEEGEDWVKDGVSLTEPELLVWLGKRFGTDKAQGILWQMLTVMPEKKQRV